MKRTVFAAVGAMVALLLSGCVGGGGPTASEKTPSPSVEATSEPSVLASLDHLVVSAEGIRAVLTDGELGENLTYFQPVDEVVTGLTEIFGVAPEVTTYEDSDSAYYVWDGFRLEPYYGPREDPLRIQTQVSVTSAEVHGIGVQTFEGLKVGDSIAAMEARFPETTMRSSHEGIDQLWIRVGAVSVVPGSDRTFSVTILSRPARGAITDISAPTDDSQW